MDVTVRTGTELKELGDDNKNEINITYIGARGTRIVRSRRRCDTWPRPRHHRPTGHTQKDSRLIIYRYLSSCPFSRQKLLVRFNVLSKYTCHHLRSLILFLRFKTFFHIQRDDSSGSSGLQS